MKSALALVFALASTVSAGEIFVGSDPADGLNPTGGNHNSTAGASYLFDTPALLGPATITLNEVNFISSPELANGPGNLTPFVALYSGDGSDPSTFTNLLVGDTLATSTGVNNLAFTVGGVNPTITVPAGMSLAAGFYQDTNIVDENTTTGGGTYRWLEQLGQPGAAFTDASSHQTGREYLFNIGGTQGLAVPEPPTATLLAIGALAIGFLYFAARLWPARNRA